MPRFALHALLLAVCAVAPASAQPTVSAVGGRTVLTGFGGPAAVGGVAVSRSVSRVVDLDVLVEVARSAEETDAALLFRSDATWHVRRHAVAALGATAYPLQGRLLGADHRLGTSVALNGRRRDDRLHQGTFSPLYFDSQPEGFIDVAAAEWEALGPGYEARVLSVAADGPGTVAGDHLALIYPSTAWEIGASAGVAYQLGVGRATLGLRADYRRFLDQPVSEGTHAFDATVRVGVRL
ncbi:hypothetical protein [Rubrivirga sp. IMCC45206]|uniref:hypothetical protein n=1 Tax=Rubrivirga sp. IMCC45206 TaxID=3391614 RepID=UPI00398FCD91